MHSRILLLTGMNADPRVFDRLLPLLPSATIVPWIEPQRHEPLSDYAWRLAADWKTGEDTVVCGVSFGGVVARELALQLDARACVLISTIRTEHELPRHLRLLRPLGAMGCASVLAGAGALAAIWPRRLRHPSTARLKRLTGHPGAWRRWATTALVQWTASPQLDAIRTTQIHGDQDQTFPISVAQPEIVIAGGGHLIALTHAGEIAPIVLKLAGLC